MRFMSRLPLFLILVLAALETGVQAHSTGTEIAHSQTLPARVAVLPQSVPAIRSATLQVQVVVQPNPVQVGLPATIYAITTPGALCSLHVT